MWWFTSVIPVFWKLRQEDCCKLEASVDCRVSLRTHKDYKVGTLSQNKHM